MASFFAALHEKDGTIKVWRDGRLAWDWAVTVIDHDPGLNKGRRGLGNIVDDLAAVLSNVETASSDPQQMQDHAQAAINGAMLLTVSADSVQGWDFPGLQIEDGKRSQHLYVTALPTPAGGQCGSIEMIPMGGARGISLGCDDLVGVLRDRIDAKTKKQQLDDAPDMKWLAVVLDGDAGIQLKHHYGGESPKRLPELDSIPFGYFDEVWAIRPTQGDRRRSKGVCVGPTFAPIFVVLRLSKGDEAPWSYVVPRPGEATT